MDPIDPVDNERTTRAHAGESFNYGANAPGLILAATAVVALTVSLFALAAGHAGAGVVALILAALSGAAAAAWLLRTHHKVRSAELRWHASNSDKPAPPPTS